jgi:CHAD domain-containing protein
MNMQITAKREMEWQFSAEGLEATRAWIAQQPAAYSERRFAPRTSLELRDTYFDSADWMVFRAGFALRLRQMREESGNESSELTLKSLTPARAGFANRLEFNELVPSGDIKAIMAEGHGLGEKLRFLVGSRPLVPLFRAHTRRERQQLLEAETDLPLAELDLDQTSIESPDGRSRQLLRVEVECLNAEPAVLAPLVEQLCVAAGLTPTTQSKFRTGLDVAGLASSLPLSLPKRAVKAGQPFALSQLAVLGRYFQVVLDQELATRSGSTRAVHEMRVAARHLETLLKAFAAHGPLWAVRSRNAIRALVKALGKVRDCDVQIGYLDAVAEKHEADEPIAAAPIRERLETERTEARAGLAVLLDAAETREWIQLWRRELAKPDAAAPAPKADSTAFVAHELIRGQARKLRKRGARIDDESTPDDYHEVRIRAKRLRYTLDAFANLYGDAAAEYMTALTKLQDVLGNYHDVSVRAQRFRKLAADPGTSRATSFALGRLVESDVPALLACRDEFPRAWRRVRRKRWRALEAAMTASDAEQR